MWEEALSVLGRGKHRSTRDAFELVNFGEIVNQRQQK